MTDSENPFKDIPWRFGSQEKVNQRELEIQILINVAEPDPRYQPYGFTDEASILDCVGVEPEEIQKRFDAYFGHGLDIPLETPLWQFVDRVKELRPDWPNS